LTPDNFAVTDGFTGAQVPGMIQVDPDGRTASFVPARSYSVNRFHSVFLSPAITDAAGNGLPFGNFFSFTTALDADVDRPRLLAASPAGAAGVPVNALVVLRFDEPVDAINIVSGLTVRTGGALVPGSIALSDGNRRATFTSAAALLANATYTVTLTTEITDLVGNPLDNPGSFSFQTGQTGDVTSPTVTAVDPANGATGVARNAVVRLQFGERIDPTTVNDGTFFLQAESGQRAAGSIAVAADGRSATFTPAQPLAASTLYFVQVSGIADLAGQTLFFFSSFTTAGAVDAQGPQVVAVSPPDGGTNVAVNAPVVVRLSEPVSALSTANAIVLTNGGGPVPGNVSLSADRMVLTFTPSALLAPSTAYSVQVAGLTDVAGNAMTAFASGFTTAAAATPDTTRPSVVSVSPVNNAMGVAVDTAITVTLNEPIDPTTVSVTTLPVSIDGFAGVVAGNYALNGAVITFTPDQALPGSVRVRVTAATSGLRDLAGNGVNFFQSSFVTAAAADLTPPEVVMVTPMDGAVEVGPRTEVVLSFSESLNPNTVNGNTLTLFANGQRLFPSVTRSADNRTVMLSTFLPAASTIAVVATSGVQDLSGNRLADFQSTFTTAASFDVSRPQIISQRPGNGATGVPLDSSIVLFASEPLDPATVAGAVRVAQNGVLVGGSVQVPGDGRSIEFIPDAPFANNALVQVFVDETARDVNGNSLFAYQGQLRTVADTAATPPAVVRTSLDGVAAPPRNLVIEVELNEALEAATVNASTVQLRQNISGTPLVSATVSLRGQRVIRLVPDAPLAANASHFIDITPAVQDRDGQGLGFTFRRFFTTAADADLAAPTVEAVSPPDGAMGVGTNAGIRVRFNEPVNPLSVSGQSVRVMAPGHTAVACSIGFSNDNRDVLITPHAPLPPNTAFTLTVEGVEDRAGNTVTPQTTGFATGNGPDTAAPQLVQTNPANGATDVAVNAVVSATFNEPLDPASLDGNSFVVRDNVSFVNVSGSRSLSPDGRTVLFMPDAPLAVGRSHSVFGTASLRDLAGNGQFVSFSFTTGFAEDATAPQVLGVSPADGLTDVPTNARVVIAFDEPVQSQSADAVTLLANGAAVDVIRAFSNANRTLTLTPRVPLEMLTGHTVDIAGVADVAGNPLAAVTTTFTTGTGVDFTGPTFTAVDPASGTTGVARSVAAQVQFSEPVNPLTVTAATFFIDTSGIAVAGAVSVAADGRSATFTPNAPLAASTGHRVRLLSGIQDLAGNAYSGTSVPATFTTGTQ
ncbi:MAG: Ig-like domain-containing protein, partial [Pseudomonadota bacterium]|nr:Ig-like domain-containing protein [Pseudomonadota bacterium]